MEVLVKMMKLKPSAFFFHRIVYAGMSYQYLLQFSKDIITFMALTKIFQMQVVPRDGVR